MTARERSKHFEMDPAQENGDCFLCKPENDLIYHSDTGAFALCGLGPLVDGYSVVATRKHARSTADLTSVEEKEFQEFAVSIRARLASKFNSCLMTEHGRLPVCVDYTGTSEPHCYHAHFLLFPGVRDLEDNARSFFRKTDVLDSLSAALESAKPLQEYYLYSPTPSRFLIMTRPGRMIRQFSRYLVAESLGRPELADWRRHPMRNEAVSMVQILRELFIR
jgi:diadenosine tetraphosphate (Ap4A) HIT family hydrolase